MPGHLKKDYRTAEGRAASAGHGFGADGTAAHDPPTWTEYHGMDTVIETIKVVRAQPPPVCAPLLWCFGGVRAASWRGG